MSSEDSRLLLGMAEKRAVDPARVAPVLRKYFAANEARLWGYALREYALV